MDSLFDDDHDEVGSDIEAYCPSPRCKADTNHTIISMYEDEVRRVQCSVCGDVHAYRKPRGDLSETPEAPSSKRPRLKKKPSWDEAMAQVTEAELAACRPYSILDTYEELDVVSHPKFGVGFATELLPDNKVEITFKDERRVLVHNRSDLAERMQPEISDAPAPRDVKKRKKRKGPQSELAARLLQERARAETQRTDFAEHALVKRMAAERAAAQRKRIAQGLEPNAEQSAELRRLDREAERERKRLEKEQERVRKAKEREEQRERKAKERDKEKARKVKEREKETARKAKEREKDTARKAKEREKLQKQREQERDKKLKERLKLQTQREQERARKAKERDRLQKERKAQAMRRTGGKKSVPSSKKKSAAAKRPKKAPKRKPAKKNKKRR